MTTQSKEPIRLAALANTPIHYQALLYRRVAIDPRLDFTVFFASKAGLADMGYGAPGVLEQNVLHGYRSEFLRHASRKQAPESPWDLRDPDIVRALTRGRYEVLWLQG